MRRAVRAIVIKGDQLLIMHRNKFGKEYDTLPGGKVEMGESLEQALLRELDEETTLKVNNQRLIFIDHAGEPYGDQYVFLCDYVGGEPQLRPGADEEVINRLGENLYRPVWLNLGDLKHKPFVSEKLKLRILNALQNGWPVLPEEF